MSDFQFDFNVAKLKAALPGIKNADGWMAACAKLLPLYGITTKQRVAMFLAQTGHESNNWNTLEENLNYRAETLASVFPRYFKDVNPADYARQPQKIANHVYANRMGNGDDASGEGYKYRGRGILQVTGKSNYLACSTALYGDDRLKDQPELLSTQEGALGSACWYWNTHKLNALSDAGSILSVTKSINGGTNGLDDRTARYNAIMKVL